MRKTFFISIFLTALGANSLPLVNYDPFYKSQVILHKHTHIQKKVQNRSLALGAIFNNRAFINNRFYEVGDKIEGYKIKKIYKYSVVLQSHSSIKVLHIQHMQQKHLIKIKQAKKVKK